MANYIVRRLLLMIVTLFGITFMTFCIISLAPGDPIAQAQAGMEMGGRGGMSAGRDLTADVIKAKRELLELDKPVLVRYVLWVKRLFTFNFGKSFRDHRPVAPKIWEAFKVTGTLNAIEILIVYLIAIPLGVFSAVNQRSYFDKALTVFLFLLYSIPAFWLAMLCVVFFGGGDFWHIFPIVGLHNEGYEKMSYFQYLGDMAMHTILPIVCMSLGALAGLSRFARTGMLEVIRQDYIRTARAKGLPERAVIFRHAFRNSLIPLVTLFAGLLPSLIGGSVIIEQIFSIPGLGRMGFSAIGARDYPVIMALSFISALLTLIGILLSDLMYCFVDPRISLD